MSKPTNPRFGPVAPSITFQDIVRQFWLDIYGKDVRSPITYSYVWLADQAGHIGIGVVLGLALTGLLKLFIDGQNWWTSLLGLVAGAVVVAYWEYRAYSSAVKVATGLFPVDKHLLKKNAVIAAAFMFLGLGLSWAFQVRAGVAIVVVLAEILLVIVLAPFWLRQKIIWQKSGLPFVYRLADVPRTIDTEIANGLQSLISEIKMPPQARPQQIVLSGSIGSGRTFVAASIGTEWAFKGVSVRYLSVSHLLELVAASGHGEWANDPGPSSIEYWPWSRAQVLIIDNFGPLISTSNLGPAASLDRMDQVLTSGLSRARAVFRSCHTVWILGDLHAPSEHSLTGKSLDGFAELIAKFCEGSEALVIELSPLQEAMAEAKVTTVSMRPPAIRRIPNFQDTDAMDRANSQSLP